MDKKSKFKIISIRQLAAVCGIPYNKLYWNITGRYSGRNGRAISDNEKIDITNHLYAELEPIAAFLGVEIKLKKRTASVTKVVKKVK